MLCYHTGKLHICMFSNGLGFGFMNLNFVEKPKYEMTLDGIVRGQEKNAHFTLVWLIFTCHANRRLDNVIIFSSKMYGFMHQYIHCESSVNPNL